MQSTPEDRAKAAWLYAQFVTSKTVSLKKSHVGLTIIRDSDIRHESFTERAAELGGLVEFYRSPARVQWTPTGTNVPDYPRSSTALVAEYRRCLIGREDAAGGDDCTRRCPRAADAAPSARERVGRMRPAFE